MSTHYKFDGADDAPVHIIPDDAPVHIIPDAQTASTIALCGQRVTPSAAVSVGDVRGGATAHWCSACAGAFMIGAR